MSRRNRKFRKQQTQLTAPAENIRPTRWTKILPFIILVFAYINIAAGSFFYPLDYDLGWHLKYGQDVVDHGDISSINKWSADMPGHKWINSSWLSDVLRYLVFTYFSFQGLMIAGILTMLATFFLFARAGKLTWFASALVLPFVVYLEIPLTSASFRAQLLSLTGMGAIVWILESYRTGNKKFLFFLLPLFFVWTNLHGGFFLGLLFIAAWSILYIFQLTFIEKSLPFLGALKKHGLALSLALLGSFLVTLINPWGWELYAEHVLVDFTSRFDKDPSQFLVEWKPLYSNSGLLTNHVIFGVVYVVSCLVLIWHKRHMPLFPIMAITTLMYLMAFNSRRFAWTTYLLSIPILGLAFSILSPKKLMLSFSLAAIGSIVFMLYIWEKQIPRKFFETDWNIYCQLTGCSPPSAEFILSRNLMSKPMYTTYDWGGWLIWNYPQIKPLVDGRMSTWTDDKGYNGFLNYIDYENDWKNIDESPYDVVYLSPGKRALFNRLLQLVDQKKWSIAYRDNFAFVFIRNSK